MNEARRAMQQALQESLDRRDNGGPAGMVSESAHPAAQAEPERAEQHPEPPVSEWAHDQLQHAFN
ncbi:hypothetical protein [Flindersiella endophytica]